MQRGKLFMLQISSTVSLTKIRLCNLLLSTVMLHFIVVICDQAYEAIQDAGLFKLVLESLTQVPQS